jgi:hypothetical protein
VYEYVFINMASESWIPLQFRDETNATATETPKRKYYDYDPSLAVNAVFIGLFALVTAGHLWLLIRKRTWYFLAFTIGCLCTSHHFMFPFIKLDWVGPL